MRILHIGKYYAPFEGGIENFLLALLRQGADAGCEHFVLAHHHQCWHRSRTEHRDECILLRSFILCKLLFAPIAPFFYTQLKRVLRQFQPDIIHVHMPNLSAFWLLLLGSRLTVPVVIHWHADIVPSRNNRLLSLAYFFYEKLERRLLARATAIIVTSPAYRDSSIPLAPWLEKCHVIPLGLDKETVDPVSTAAPQATWPGGSRLRLLCIGRLTYYKGQQYLIRALAGLPDAQLVLVGTGKYMGRYEKLIGQLNLQDRVQLFGHATTGQLHALLDSCDCLCLPSIERTEAFGLVLLEAMAHGKPCLCTAVSGSGMGWVVEDEVSGLVVEPADENALRQAIERLHADAAWRRQLGEAGRQRFHEHFSLPSVTQAILDMYNEVLNRGSTKAISHN